MTEILKQSGLGPVAAIHMCDALSRNIPKEFETILPTASLMAAQLCGAGLKLPRGVPLCDRSLAEVYHHDQKAKEQDFSPSNVSDCIRSRAVPSWKGSKSGCRTIRSTEG